MKKILYIVLFCLLAFVPVVYAIQAIHLPGVGGGAGNCSSQSAEVTVDSYTSGSSDIYDGATHGNEFTVGASNIVLYSIRIYIKQNTLESEESDTLTCRVGTGPDLTETYLDEGTLVVNYDEYNLGWAEIIMPSRVTLNATTQYTFGCAWPRDNTDALRWAKSDSDVYPANDRRYDSITPASWNLAQSSSDNDLNFMIMKCD